jgi:hypothetical protein
VKLERHANTLYIIVRCIYMPEKIRAGRVAAPAAAAGTGVTKPRDGPRGDVRYIEGVVLSSPAI